MIYNLSNIIFKSLLTTLLIGYIIFNITYIRNNCPVDNNIFEICSQFDLDDSFENRSILKDQRIIMYNYFNLNISLYIINNMSFTLDYN